MESVGPCAALEQEMSRARSLTRLIAGGAIVLPLFASAHGTEFLDARLEVAAGGQVKLCIIADYGGNPMIADEAEARRALQEALRVRLNGNTLPLESLVISARAAPDPQSPMPRGPEDLTQPHQLLAATWAWQGRSDTIQFVVPRSNQQTVLLWMPGTPAQWTMLIPGDEGPVIRLHWYQSRAWMWVLAVVLLLPLVYRRR